MELVTKPGTKAPVWEFFGLKKAEDRTGIDDGNVFVEHVDGKLLRRTETLQTHHTI
jgi:hypothetical protein